MQNSDLPGIKGPAGIRRKLIRVSEESLVTAERLQPETALPLVIQPRVPTVSLTGWAASNREFIETKLASHGAILFRNFNPVGITEFEQLIESVCGSLLDYSYRSTPRTRVSGRIYTSTEYPARQFIPLHNEMSYSRSWPMRICFFCVEPADEGGETPIADSRKVFELIPPAIKERFAERGLLYVRNYGEGMDLSWEDVFQTTDKAEVEQYCHEAGIEFEWADGSRLSTRQLCQAVAAHPKTGEMVWFNQAHLFHVSSLQTEVADALLSTLDAKELPRNVYYGDGTAIESSVLDEIRGIYDRESIVFRWQQGDILMLDNMLTAHGRRPYSGSRKVLVGMAEPFASESI
jgi:alpha-ketoglutarate-dependent taurine dioxygenase